MTDHPDPHEAEARELAAAARTLVDRIGEFNQVTGAKLGDLYGHSRHNRRLITALAVSLALDVLLTVVLAVGGAAISRNADRIDTLTHRLEAQDQRSRSQALCPLYDLFLASRNPASRARYPDGERAYDRAFATIENGRRALNCERSTSGRR